MTLSPKTESVTSSGRSISRIGLKTIRKIFSGIEHIYIADGHHRAASAVKVGLKRRAEHPGYDSTEEFNYFLSVLFPADELCIYDYNRVVDGLNGYTFDTLLEKLKDTFLIEKTGTFRRPLCKGELALYGNNSWYSLKIHSRIFTGGSRGRSGCVRFTGSRPRPAAWR